MESKKEIEAMAEKNLKIIESYLDMPIFVPKKYMMLLAHLDQSFWVEIKASIKESTKPISYLEFKKERSASRLYLFLKEYDGNILKKIFIGDVVDKAYIEKKELQIQNQDLAAYHISDKGWNASLQIFKLKAGNDNTQILSELLIHSNN